MTTHKNGESNPFRTGASRLLTVLKRLRDVHPDMTLLQASYLLHVAANPGVTQRATYEALDSNDSIGSRTLAMLSDIGGRNVPALDLIAMTINPMDRRERLLDLTPKGRRLMADLMRDLGQPLGG